MNKRDFIKAGALAGVAAMTMNSDLVANTNINDRELMIDKNGKYILPPLPYSYDALSAAIDEETMKLHHDIHHLGYVNGLNKAMDMIKLFKQSGDYSMAKHWERELAFHGAGHFLHTIFWYTMGEKNGKISPKLNEYINRDFGGFEHFKKQFIATSNSVEGSGWGILAYIPNVDKLVILQAEKHQNQSQWLSIPILVLDVWEHAYYLKYQNKRAEYCENFFKVINWVAVSERFEGLLK